MAALVLGIKGRKLGLDESDALAVAYCHGGEPPMIAAVRGKIFQLSPGRVAVDTGAGVILQLVVPVSSFQRLREGQEVLLHTVLKIKDEDIVLYGFLEPRGKGPVRKADRGIGHRRQDRHGLRFGHRPGEWRAVIAAADVARISSIPGIGKKTAQRIILELTGKLEVEACGGRRR